MELKKTPLYQKHIQNKGRIIDFAGWALPVEYKSTLEEAKAVRKTCGLFDITHMGEILIRGDKAFESLQKLTSNNIFSMSRGQMQYNLFLNRDGGIIDDFVVYHLGEDLLCVVNASNKDKVLLWLKRNLKDGAEALDLSDELTLLSIQGPCSCELMKKVFGKNVAYLDYMRFVEQKYHKTEVLISRSGYTGEDGFEVYIPPDDACYWWDRLIKAGSHFGMALCGLASRDILRIEAGYPLHGYEIDDKINPYEACLGWAVKLDKDFIAKETILRQRDQGLKRRRAGFIMQEKAFPRQDYLVFIGEREVGKVCSGAYSPNLDNFIGMAYIEKDSANIDTEIHIKIRDKLKKAKIVKFPFVEIRTKKSK